MIPVWLNIAINEVGTCEFPGIESNPRIVEYLKSVTGDHDITDSTPWCSAFLNWCFNQVNISGANSLLGRSWLKWGRQIETPIMGCIVVLSSPFHVWGSHIGFWIIHSENSLLMLSGNSDNQVRFSLYNRSRVLGYRWPLFPNR